MSEHLDLDALADVLADGPYGHGDGGGTGRSSGERAAHLASCAGCTGRLTELEVAVGHVAGALAALPEPELPAGLAERLDAAMAAERDRAATGRPAIPGDTKAAVTQGAKASAATADVVPLAGRRGGAPRWLSIAGGVAAAAAVVFGGVLLTQQGGSSNTTASKASARLLVAMNSTGTAYAKDGKALAAALPALLKGSSTQAFAASSGSADSTASTGDTNPAPATGNSPSPNVIAPKATQLRSLAPPQDTLATLRGTAGLASCLSGLTDPGDPGVPLAVDYATFDGKPAMVVILPSAKASKVDVYVVGAGCVAKDSQLLFFTRLPKPQPSGQP